MNDENLLKLIEKFEEIGIKYFNDLSACIDGHTNKKMILFTNQPGETRKINDWGRDEDTDYHIGISETGWEKYVTIYEVGAGETVLLEDRSIKLSSEDVLEIVNQSRIKDYLYFMKNCYEIIKKYSAEFGSMLY